MKRWRLFLALVLCCGVGVGVWLAGCGDDDPVVICNDVDGDGYGNPISFLCPNLELDCDDANAAVNPGATEGPVGDATCNDGLDNNCNGLTDAEDPNCREGEEVCTDNDMDGYGDPASGACESPDLDCDDANAAVNPGATEGPAGDATCSDGLDNNCNGLTDGDDPNCREEEVCTDNDMDGYGDPASGACESPELDCDDGNAAVNPGATEGPAGDATCSDGLDNNCNGLTDAEDPNCQEAPATITLSGKVVLIDISNALPPVAGATVELLDGSMSTTSGEDGSWTLADVPVTDEDPYLKITKAGYPVAINVFPVSQGVVQYDLQVLDSTLFNVLIGMDPNGPHDTSKACLILGAVVGFESLDYPQVPAMLAGATVNVTPGSLQVVYINDAHMPDPSLTETSSQGSFDIVVPDANIITSISLSGSRGGVDLEAPPYYPTLPGAFVMTGLVDPSY